MVYSCEYRRVPYRNAVDSSSGSGSSDVDWLW